MKLRPGLIVADRFRLVRPLGEGGMGAVWLGQQTALDVPCALKFIHEEAAKSTELRARFEREAKAAAQLRSPNVVQILDHGLWEGAPYIAMELLEGEDLDHRLRQRRTLPARETLAIAAQVGRALAKAHSASLVHRDLKPANIFITRDEDREIVKVLDFGVAKVSEAGMDGSTRTGAVLGTPFYMSPEQARGSKTIDHRSDLWALAVVVYQCMTGQLPFNGEALGDLFVKIIIEELPVPSQVASVPLGFDAWWARAAARDPQKRFQSAKEFTDALGLALGVTAGEDVSALNSSAPSGAAAIPLGGTVALTPSQPIPPYSGGTPYPGGNTPYPSTPQGPSGQWQAQSAPGTSNTPYPVSQAPSLGAATPMQQAMSMHGAPAPRRAGLITGVVIGLVVLGIGGAAFVALRPKAPAASASTIAAAPPPPATAPVASVASAAPLPASPPTATVASVAPSVTATAVAPVAPIAGKGRAPVKPASGVAPKPPAAPKDSLGF